MDLRDNRLITEKELLAMLSISRTSLWRLRKTGQIKAVRQIGKRVHYRTGDVAAYLAALPTCDEQK